MCGGARISSLSDAVRVARSYDRANRPCVVVQCFGAIGPNGAVGAKGAVGAIGSNDFGSNGAATPHWHITESTRSVLDPIMIDGACDAMRALPPIEWDAAYEAAVQSGCRAARRKIRTLVVPRGVDFWREYYGAPRRSTERLVEEHNASRAQWDPAKVIAPMNEQHRHLAYRTRVRDIVRETARWLAKRLRSIDQKFDARLVEGAFRLITGRNGVDAVLVKKSGSPLAGAMYPLHTLGSLHAEKWTFVPMRPEDLDHVHKNERVLVVGVLDDPALASLLTHEIAHAITLPLWTDANHPPAFHELEAIVATCPALVRLAPAKKAQLAPAAAEPQRLSALARAFIDDQRAPSPPRSAHPRASSSRRAGSRRSP
jgi:hypothetical protein